MADDYGSTPTTAGLVALNAQVSGNIETVGDQDWFAITLEAGTTYQFELLGSGSGGGNFGADAADFPMLQLRDATGKTIKSTTRGGIGDDPMMTYTAIASGTHYLAARDGSIDDGTGTYTVRTSLAEYPPNFVGGTADYDVLTATERDDIVAGGDGIDVVIYPGARSEYQLIGNTRGDPIAVTRGLSDHLFNVERIHFDDAGVAYDFDGNAGKVARSINALYGNNNPEPTFIARGLAMLDQGMSFETYMQHYLDEILGVDATSEEIVTLLYTNVARRDPPAQAMEFYTGLLDSGIWPTGQLAVYAAEHMMNLGNVNYAGWLRVGMTFWLGESQQFHARNTGAVQPASLAPSMQAQTVDDFGNAPDTAGTLAVGATAAGALETIRDSDWFAITLTAGTTYAFELLASTAKGGSFTVGDIPVLLLRDASGDNVKRADIRGPDGDLSMTHTVLSSGTYYLEVRDGSFSGATGNYSVRATLAEYPPNYIAGTSGNDVLIATAKDDIIVGGDGVDTVVFAGRGRDYQVINHRSPGEFAVTRELSDHLFGIERLRFDDVAVAYDFSGNAGIVARSVNAFFGQTRPANTSIISFLGEGIALLDQGMSYEQYMQRNLDTFLGVDATSEEIVSFLYTNVAQREPPAQAMDFYTNLLDSGIWTPGTLAMYAADHSQNVTMELIGWMRTGMVYELV